LHLDLHSAQDHLKGHAGKRFAATWPRKTKSFVLAAASLKLVAEIAQLPHSIIDIENPGQTRIKSSPRRRLDVWFERAAQWSFRRRVEPLWSFYP
jgi:hypothetical protein